MKKLVFLIITLFVTARLFAGIENYPVGGKAAGMSNASVIYSDLWSVHHNQAGLAGYHRMAIGFYNEYKFLSPDLGLKALAFTIPVFKETIGISLSHFGNQDMNEQKFGLAIAKPFGDKFFAGIQLNYHRLFLSEVYGRAGGISTELGILANPVKNFWAGVHVFNPTHSKINDTDGERIPTVCTTGLGYFFSEKFSSCIESEIIIDNQTIYNFKAGIDYDIYKKIFLRVGGTSNPEQFSFGLGFEVSRINADVAFTYHQIFGFYPQFSISYAFKRWSEEGS